ncbi:MAG: TldD/PmbA family protein, partial [Candidatus Goldbacteria bacterium]|nr:TldD/PmbA family protein [Candidatus Goldiibacteriota bacterium]
MEELIEIAKKRLKEKNIYGDIYIENIIKTEIIVNESAVEKITKSDTINGNVRVIKNGKMGFCYFSGKEKNIIDESISKAINSTFIEGYEKYLFNNINIARQPETFDNSYKNINDETKINMTLLLEKSVKENPLIKSVRDTNYTDTLEKTYYVNSENLQVYNEKTKFFIYTSAVAEKNSNREMAECFEFTSLLKEIDIEKLGKDCAKKAINLLNTKKIKSGKYKILLPSEIACDLVSLLSKMFLGDNIVKGKSLLSSYKPGDKIASDILTIKDDALLNYKIGSFSIDGEGVIGKNKYVIENGILKSFLFDKKSAYLYNTDSTGNCIRTNFKLLPECGVSNFYIINGNDSIENIIKNFTVIH